MIIITDAIFLSPILPYAGQGASSGSSSGIAQRARHPDELKREDGKWIIDIEYYLSQQVLHCLLISAHLL